METKVCVICNTEKSIDNSYNKCRECKPCNIKRSTKRYYENKDKIANQLLTNSKLNQQNRNYERKKYINNKYKNSKKSEKI